MRLAFITSKVHLTGNKIDTKARSISLFKLLFRFANRYRDDFIIIYWDNIKRGREHNFNKYNDSIVSNFDVPYDYDSVLHYSAKAFSKNGNITIEPIVSLNLATKLICIHVIFVFFDTILVWIHIFGSKNWIEWRWYPEDKYNVQFHLQHQYTQCTGSAFTNATAATRSCP